MPTPTTIAPTRSTSSASVTDALAASSARSRIEPAHRAALVTRAVILRKLGRAQDALTSCDRALALMA